MSANGWDSDGTAGPAGDESPEAGRTPGVWDMFAGQNESAPGPLGQDPLAADPLVPGLTVRSPALDYMLAKQRRRMRHVATAAFSILAIVVVAALVTIAVHSATKKVRSAELTVAQVVQQAARQQEALNSESGTFSEQLSGAASATINGTTEMQFKPLMMAVNMTASSGGKSATIQGIITGSAMYLKLGSQEGLPKYLAAQWLKIPLTGLSPSSQFAVVQRELQNENPASEFAALRAASHLQEAGTQLVGGAATTKYTGSFTPAAAVKLLPSAQRAALAPYLDLIKGDVAIRVWIDSRHFVRKLQETESVGDVTIAIDCKYGSFNQPVKIALPSPRQIYSPPASALNA